MEGNGQQENTSHNIPNNTTLWTVKSSAENARNVFKSGLPSKEIPSIVLGVAE